MDAFSASTQLRQPVQPSRIGGVARPPSAQSIYSRPQSVAAHSGSKSFNPATRPATSMNQRALGASVQGAREPPSGKFSIYISNNNYRDRREARQHRITSDSSVSTSSANSRSTSSSLDALEGRHDTEAGRLLVGQSLQELSRNQPSVRVVSLCGVFDSLSLAEGSSRPKEGQDDEVLEPPQTPIFQKKSSLPIPSPKRDTKSAAAEPVDPLSILDTVAKNLDRCMPSQRPASPTKANLHGTPLFLHRDSNLKAPPAAQWGQTDTTERIAHMEGMFEALKSQMEGTTFERSSMKEIVDLLRQRGMASGFEMFVALSRTDSRSCRA